MHAPLSICNFFIFLYTFYTFYNMVVSFLGMRYNFLDFKMCVYLGRGCTPIQYDFPFLFILCEYFVFRYILVIYIHIWTEKFKAVLAPIPSHTGFCNSPTLAGVTGDIA